jgi:hypothetical protein
VGTHVHQKNVTPEQAQRLLMGMKQHSTAPYWRQLEVVLDTDQAKHQPPSYKRAMLKCSECGGKLEASNPHRVGKSHFNEQGHCKAACKAAGVVPGAGPRSCGDGGGASASAGARASAEASPSTGQRSSTKRRQSEQGGMDRYCPTPAMALSAKQQLYRFIFRKGSFRDVEDPDLRGAFKALGVELEGGA